MNTNLETFLNLVLVFFCFNYDCVQKITQLIHFYANARHLNLTTNQYSRFIYPIQNMQCNYMAERSVSNGFKNRMTLLLYETFGYRGKIWIVQIGEKWPIFDNRTKNGFNN